MKISDKNIEEYLKNYKSRESIPLNCDYCNWIFEKVKKEIQNSLSKDIYKSFCNRKCFGLFYSTKKLYNCLLCNKELYKIPSDIKGNIFCGHSCSAKFNNKNRFLEKRNFSDNGLINIKNCIQSRLEKRIILYNLNPSHCKSCNEIISYKNREKIYCGKECRFSNCKIKKSIVKCRKVKEIKLRLCKKLDCQNTVIKKKQYCNLCKYNYYEIYKPKCLFKFNIYKYSEIIEGFEFIKTLGRYSPSNRGNNLNGASLDHMYSVKEGFINNIDPEIISHPANCRILPHVINNSKNTNSSITLNKLLEKIKLINNLEM